MSITLEQAKNLRHGTILYHTTNRNADKSPQRWRVNGVPKTWKREPWRVRVPVKWGLKVCDYITEKDLDLVSLTPEEAMKDPKEKERMKHPKKSVFTKQSLLDRTLEKFDMPQEVDQ